MALVFFDQCHASTQADIDCEDASTQADFCVSDITTQMLLLSSLIPEREQADAICKLMQGLAVKSSLNVPDGYISDSLAAMQRLQHAGRSNILAQLAKAFGATRPDGIESLMPVNRMPVGLIEYVVNFFTSNSVSLLQQHTMAHIMYSLTGSYCSSRLQILVRNHVFTVWNKMVQNQWRSYVVLCAKWPRYKYYEHFIKNPCQCTKLL